MEKTLKIKLLLILVAIFAIITIISDNFSDTNPYMGLYEKNSRIRSNGSWVITSTIHIDDSNPSINWSKTAADNPWCSGTGTWNDPYLIENLTIDGLFEGSCIYIENSNIPFIIRNCTLVNIGTGSNPNYDSGIRLDTVSNGLIINNTCSFNNGRGIYLRDSSNNTVCYNNASNNERTGIYVYTSNVNTIFGNTFNYNDDGGIYIYQGNYNNFSENFITHTKVSMSDFSTRYIELTGQNNIFSGNIFKNCGIRLREGSLNALSSHQIDTTNLVNGKPIYYYANTNDLKKDNFSNAGQVILVGCDNCEISGLNMSYGGPGISLFHCDQNTVFSNTISFHFSEYIKLYSSHQNNISHNSISDVGISPGINLRYSNENNVTFNQIINCNTAIEVGTSYWNTIRDNYLDNNYRGMYIQTGQIGDMNNIIMRNIISNNNEGIYTTSPYTRANTIYLNNFINNGVNAENNGGSNYWDNGSIGNYWDDYGGVDANDDGIGDTQYIIPGIAGDQDNFPIWWDVPQFGIVNPRQNQLFSNLPPNFTITIYEGLPDTIWYTLGLNMTKYNVNSNGTIDYDAWASSSEGYVEIRFYINDTRNYVNNEQVIVRKDISVPQISLVSPLNNTRYGINAPTYNISIFDFSFNASWYTINNDSIKYIIEANFGAINQEIWDSLPDGNLTINFYANDTLGHLNSIGVVVRKDTNKPVIIIHDPLLNQIFGANSPKFNISIEEETSVYCWYTVEGVVGNFSFSTLNGTINQSAWNAAHEGALNITFYVKDEVGNIGTKSIVVIKRLPSITTIPGYNLFIFLSMLSVISILGYKKIKKA